MSQSGRYLAGTGGAPIETLTGNSGGAVGANGSGNINLLGSGEISIVGVPASNELTVSLSNGTNGQLLIGGGAAPAWANLTSTGATITITEGANSINLEAAGGGASQFDADSGSATPAAGVITMAGGANITTSGAGSTVTHALDDAISLPATNGAGTAGALFIDSNIFLHAFNDNTFVGANAGNLTMSSTTCVGFGNGALSSLTSGDENTAVGAGALSGVAAGGGNIGIGKDAGSNLTGSDAGNICIGNLGTIGDNATLRIGQSITDTYIDGIYNAAGNANAYVVIVDTDDRIRSIATLDVARGGTGLSTITDHGVLVGSGTGAVTPLAVGTDGQVLLGSSAADPVFATLTSTGSTIAFTPGAGTLNLETAGAVASSFPTDSGTATPSGGALTVAGGTNINTAGATDTATFNLDVDLVTMDSVTFNTGGSLRTGTTSTNTLLLQAYDVGAVAYETFATLTADATTPTMDLSDSVTKSGGYIYRAGGTDVPIADGGTGVSSLTAYAVVCGGTTSTNPVQSIASVGTSGQVLTSNGAGALPTFQDASSGGGITWNEETTTSVSMAVNNGYITNNAGLVTATLPDTAAVGDIVAIAGSGAGGWRIAQNASEIVHFGNVNTSTGAGGYLEFTNRYDSVELICIVANTEWVVRSSIGNITVN